MSERKQHEHPADRDMQWWADNLHRYGVGVGGGGAVSPWDRHRWLGAIDDEGGLADTLRVARDTGRPIGNTCGMCGGAYTGPARLP